jgi:hypothetical protein
VSVAAVTLLEGPRVRASWIVMVAATLGLAALAGPLAAMGGLAVMPAALAPPVFLAVMSRPKLGAWLYLLATPFIVGIARNGAVPIRPNEALLILIVAALVTRALILRLAGQSSRPQVDHMDLALVVLATTSSILPLLFRYGRDLPISTDDILYALVMWKYYVVYRIFRSTISTPSDVAVSLDLAMLSAAGVALIAMLQVLGLFGVAEFLATYYDRPFTGVDDVVTARGTSTLASSFGLADMMGMCLAMALAWLPGAPRQRRWVLWAAAGIFLLGTITAGQFSGVIGLLVAVFTVGLVTGRLGRIFSVLIPGAFVASLAFWKVIALRLIGFAGGTELPSSWTGRLENLQRFVWPELTSGLNWLLSVRPSARIPAPEMWRDWVFIESGYLWLLWTGGLPMLLAFLFFCWTALAALLRSRREHAPDPIGVAATAALAGLALMTVLMLLDPHLTMRGSADLFFPLLALACVHSPHALQAAQRQREHPMRPLESKI